MLRSPVSLDEIRPRWQTLGTSAKKIRKFSRLQWVRSAKVCSTVAGSRAGGVTRGH